jgi:hypothetical protein
VGERELKKMGLHNKVGGTRYLVGDEELKMQLNNGFPSKLNAILNYDVKNSYLLQSKNGIDGCTLLLGTC